MKILLVFFTIIELSIVVAIFDGSIAKQYQFPYIVLTNSPQFYCSASLISPLFVLTAAHCLMSVPKGGSIKVTISAYEYYGSSYSDGILIKSKRFWIHENFSMPLAENDIGLIQLPTAIVPSEKVNFIGIDINKYADYDLMDSKIVIAGWGFTRPSQAAKQLRFTNMKLLPLHECLKYNGNYIESLTVNHICASKITGMPCNGDSGSSFVSLKTGKIVGILSYVKDAENGVDLKYNDCKSNIPVVATRVSSYINWIYAKSGLRFK